MWMDVQEEYRVSNAKHKKHLEEKYARENKEIREKVEKLEQIFESGHRPVNKEDMEELARKNLEALEKQKAELLIEFNAKHQKEMSEAKKMIRWELEKEYC